MVSTAVIVEAVRTPMGRGRPPRGDKPGGSLSGLHAVDLLSQTLLGLIERSAIDPGLVEDVIIGCVSQAAEQAFTPGRLAWLGAGLPEHVPGVTIDRRCGSGQQAVEFAAHGIMAGGYDIVVAGGVESMSRVPMGTARMGADVFGDGIAQRYAPGLVGQGVAAELVAARYGITRADMDEYAVRSHQRAEAARDVMQREIVPVTVPGKGAGTVVTADETIRAGSTPQGMAGLRPAFADDDAALRHPEITWSVTAGNSSQIADGAAALLLMSEERAAALGLRARARIVATAVVGSDPMTMLTGPIPATEKVLARAGLTLAEMDHVEVNEAFASVPLAWQRHFGADGARLNPSGGAIALGHPLGASGARLLTTMLGALEASGGRYGLQTMCENGGMANAIVIERL
jgi:acetyl-CoA acyltransferase